jgi:hypothetical protein
MVLILMNTGEYVFVEDAFRVDRTETHIICLDSEDRVVTQFDLGAVSMYTANAEIIRTVIREIAGND